MAGSTALLIHTAITVAIVVGLIVFTKINPVVSRFTWDEKKDDDPLIDPEHTGEIVGYGLPPGVEPSGEQAAIAHDQRDPAPSPGGGATAVARDPQPVTAGAVAAPKQMPLLLAVPPLVLILAQTSTSEAGAELALLGFLGNPVVALLIGLLVGIALAVPALGRRCRRGDREGCGDERRHPDHRRRGIARASHCRIAETDVGDLVASPFSATAAFPVVLAWLVATLLRLAQGSGSVAHAVLSFVGLSAVLVLSIFV